MRQAQSVVLLEIAAPVEKEAPVANSVPVEKIATVAELRRKSEARSGWMEGCTNELYNLGMKQLNVSAFREQCLALLEALPAEGVLITKRGQPIARLVPIRENDGDLIGSLAGQLKIKGNIFSTGEKWNAES
jgi:antitoxin (DNA-binding transcriptional repressor) of toxin-antitoxin stability system